MAGVGALLHRHFDEMLSALLELELEATLL
jgi:hypothetical protein